MIIVVDYSKCKRRYNKPFTNEYSYSQNIRCNYVISLPKGINVMFLQEIIFSIDFVMLIKSTERNYIIIFGGGKHS